MHNKLDIEHYANFLIIQTAFIGDIALAIYFTEELKFYNPNAKITFITTKQAAELVECSESVSEVIIFDKRNKDKGIKGIFHFARQLNSLHNFDIVFTIHRSFRSAILTKLINAKYKIGFDVNSLSFLLTHRVKYRKTLHEIERNRQLFSVFLESKHIFQKNNNLNIKTNKDDIDFANTLLENYKQIFSNSTTGNNTSKEQQLIIIAAGSVWATKRWCIEYFAELSKILIQKGYKVILIGSRSEIELCNKISSESGAISIAGKTTIPQTLAILKQAKLIITNDSAPTHFASILNIPTVTIFGPTSPSFGFAPLADKSIVVEDKNLLCRPCSPHGQQKCPIKTHECMKNITPQKVLDMISIGL